MNTTFDFTGKVALITGAAGGIGGVLADLLHASGADLILADIDLAGVTAKAAELTGPGRSIAVQVDSSDPESIDSLIERVRSEFGELDFLVPSAGIYPTAMLADMTFAQWRQVMSINLDGIFLLTQRMIPIMRSGLDCEPGIGRWSPRKPEPCTLFSGESRNHCAHAEPRAGIRVARYPRERGFPRDY